MNTRAPTVEAVMQTVRAECSDSTLTNSAASSPLDTHSLRASTTGDCGVIG